MSKEAKMDDIDHKILEDHFHLSDLTFLSSESKSLVMPTVLVKDASDFVLDIFDKRGQIISDFFVQIFVDKGRDFLKISVSLVPKSSDDSAKGEKFSGVNKSFILAIVPGNHIPWDRIVCNQNRLFPQVRF